MFRIQWALYSYTALVVILSMKYSATFDSRIFANFSLYKFINPSREEKMRNDLFPSPTKWGLFIACGPVQMHPAGTLVNSAIFENFQKFWFSFSISVYGIFNILLEML